MPRNMRRVKLAMECLLNRILQSFKECLQKKTSKYKKMFYTVHQWYIKHKLFYVGEKKSI